MARASTVLLVATALLAATAHAWIEQLSAARVNRRFCRAGANITDDRQNCGIAIFSGGGFMRLKTEMEGAEGVYMARLGYTGGFVKNPTYEDVCLGKTGHNEAVMVFYDRSRTNVTKLLVKFWASHDPWKRGAQVAADSSILIGAQFRSTFFVFQKSMAIAFNQAKAEMERGDADNNTITTRLAIFSGDFYFETRADSELTNVRAISAEKIKKRIESMSAEEVAEMMAKLKKAERGEDHRVEAEPDVARARMEDKVAGVGNIATRDPAAAHDAEVMKINEKWLSGPKTGERKALRDLVRKVNMKDFKSAFGDKLNPFRPVITAVKDEKLTGKSNDDETAMRNEMKADAAAAAKGKGD